MKYALILAFVAVLAIAPAPIAAAAIIAILVIAALKWDAVEYVLILAFIAVLMIVALKFLQPSISNTLNQGGMSL